MPIAITLLLGAFITKLIDFFKFVTNGDFNGVITQLVVWVSGVVGVTLVAQTDFAVGVEVGDLNLTQLNGWSLLFVGLMASSIFSVVNDVRNAIDNTGSAVTPPLLGTNTSGSATATTGNDPYPLTTSDGKRYKIVKQPTESGEMIDQRIYCPDDIPH
jgi:hypothetical protein